MIDRDEVLPIPSEDVADFILKRRMLPIALPPSDESLWGALVQRDADWERGMLWLTALKELLTVAAHSNNCGVFVNIGDHVEFNPDGCTCPHGRATALLAQLFAQKEER